MILSASQIESFDSRTTFGCERKWWFEKVKGLKGGKDTALVLGDAVHQTLEAFLKGAGQGVLHDLVIGAPGALEYLIGLRKRVRLVESKFGGDQLILAGVPLAGKIDWIAADAKGYDPVFPSIELGDHKTSSNLAKYAKTPGQLKKSVQMNVYAAWLSRNLDAFDSLKVTQDFYQTKGAKKFEVVSCEISKRENAESVLEIEATIERMVKVSKSTEPEQVTPNLKACHIGYGCPHRAYCPQSGAFNMASLLDAFKETTPTPPPPEPPPVPTGALPPDAPKSDPAIASEPPPDNEIEVETEPKKRGRKPGSQNKPKNHASQEEIAQMQSAQFVPELPSIGPVTIHRISIRHGAKIGMPNFSSALVEVEAEGIVNGDVEAAKESLSLQVKAMMVKELEVYKPKEPAK